MSSDSQILPSSEREDDPTGSVVHLSELSTDLQNLRLSDSLADAVLIVEKKRFPVHRVVLAARCEYFRALFYGGMLESARDPSNEVELKETPSEAFSHLLCYVYEGQIQLSSLSSQTLLELVALANQFNLPPLQTAVCDYLVSNLTVSNACSTLDMAIFFGLKHVRESCSAYIDRNAENILKTSGLFQLSKEALVEMLQRDSFFAPEIDIFKAVAEWCKANSESALPSVEVSEKSASSCTGCYEDVLGHVRLPLISISDLFGAVRASKLFSDTFLLDSIEKRLANDVAKPHCRGRMVPNKWLINTSCTAISGKNAALLLSDINYATSEIPMHRFPADSEADSAAGITVCLPCPHVINLVTLQLSAKPAHFSSYRVFVGLDSNDKEQPVVYRQLFDYSRYHCRAHQHLHFEPCVARYIRVVGMSASYSQRDFQLLKLDAMYTTKLVPFCDGLKVPEENVAHIHKDAIVLEGVSRIRNSVIDGQYHDFNWDAGYTCHQIENGCIIIALAQPVIATSMRLLLWDCDGRQYSYCVDVSLDNESYHRVCDKTKHLCRSWQTIRFDSQRFSYIKLIGTYNSENEVFHCVHFECPASPSTNALAVASAEAKPDVLKSQSVANEQQAEQLMDSTGP
ncbi:BTB/POZ domain-containing protein 9-like [Sycon ciliatum]|uniref:BTB/POZ domain-containing protein 9-like n=1 Tax=Sycon ciliatum TaxID=27933 RepID=UPI0031F6BF42